MLINGIKKSYEFLRHFYTHSILNIFTSAFLTPIILKLNNFICTVHFYRAIIISLFGFHGTYQNHMLFEFFVVKNLL